MKSIMNKKTLIVSTVVTALAAALGTFVVKTLMGDDSAGSVDKMLMQAASETNKSLPMMLDKETRLDATVAGPGNRFTYSYSLVNYDERTMDTASLKQYLKPRILANYKSHEQLKSFRENNVEL